MQRKSLRFQMFCFHSRKASQTPWLMSSQTARSLLRPGKPSVGGLTHLFRLLSSFSALFRFRPLMYVHLPLHFTGSDANSAVVPSHSLSLQDSKLSQELGPWCRNGLGAPQVILWTSWPSPLTFNPTLRVLLSSSFHLSLSLVPRELIFLHSSPPSPPSSLHQPVCFSASCSYP